MRTPCATQMPFVDVSAPERGFVRGDFTNTWLTASSVEDVRALLEAARDPDRDPGPGQMASCHGAMEALLACSGSRPRLPWRTALEVHDVLQAWRLAHGRTEEARTAPRALAAAWLKSLPMKSLLPAVGRLTARPGGCACVLDALCGLIASGELGTSRQAALLHARPVRAVLCEREAGTAGWIRAFAAMHGGLPWQGSGYASLGYNAEGTALRASMRGFMESLPGQGRADVLQFARCQSSAWRADFEALPDARSRQEQGLAAGGRLFCLELLRTRLATARHEDPDGRALQELLREAPDLVYALALARRDFLDAQAHPDAMGDPGTRASMYQTCALYFQALEAAGAGLPALARALPSQHACLASTPPADAAAASARRAGLDRMWLSVLRHPRCTPRLLAEAGVARDHAVTPAARAAMDALHLGQRQPTPSRRRRLA